MATKKTGTKTDAADIRIVILQRGWVMVGRYSRDGVRCKLESASVIRRWGTSRGLGELAAEGPRPNTVIEKAAAGEVEFHELTVIATLACDAAKWSEHVAA